MNTGRPWILITVSAFAILLGSFFYFLGAVIHFVGDSDGKKDGNVAIVEVIGGIFESKPILEQLTKIKKDKDIKAVILRVDSPGGSVAASQEIYEAIKDLKSVKPVVVSMGTVAASGGYYVSIPASKIVANAGTITGSIGVRMEYMNVEDLLQWARVRPVTLKSGRMKDIGSPTRPMTEEERVYLEGVLKALHAQFKKAIAEDRGIAPEEVDKIADGRIFTGVEAQNLKLVDEIGALDKAVKVAAELAGIKGDPEVFYYPKEKESFVQQLMEGSLEGVLKKGLSTLMMSGTFSYR